MTISLQIGELSLGPIVSDPGFYFLVSIVRASMKAFKGQECKNGFNSAAINIVSTLSALQHLILHARTPLDVKQVRK